MVSVGFANRLGESVVHYIDSFKTSLSTSPPIKSILGTRGFSLIRSAVNNSQLFFLSSAKVFKTVALFIGIPMIVFGLVMWIVRYFSEIYSRIAVLQSSLYVSKVQVATSEKTIHKLNLELSKKEAELKNKDCEQVEKISVLEGDIKRARADLRVAQEEMRRLSTALNTKDREIDTLKRNLDNSHKDYKELMMHCSSISDRFNRLKDNLYKAKKHIEKSNKKNLEWFSKLKMGVEIFQKQLQRKDDLISFLEERSGLHPQNSKLLENNGLTENRQKDTLSRENYIDLEAQKHVNAQKEQLEKDNKVAEDIASILQSHIDQLKIIDEDFPKELFDLV